MTNASVLCVRASEVFCAHIVRVGHEHEAHITVGTLKWPRVRVGQIVASVGTDPVVVLRRDGREGHGESDETHIERGAADGAERSGLMRE